MKIRNILILSMVVFILLLTSIAYAVTSENPFEALKSKFILLTEKLKDDNLSRDEKIAAYDERKKVMEQYKEEIDKSKSSSEDFKKLELQKERDDILKDIIDAHKITVEDYTILEFNRLNDFFSGKIEGFEDKDFLEKAKPLINEFYFYKDVQKGNKRPFIMVKKDTSEILVIYKDYQGNNVVQKAKKANDTWEKSKLVSAENGGNKNNASPDKERQAEVAARKAKVEKYKKLAAERNAKPLTEEQKAYEAKQAAIREEIWQDIVDAYDIDTDSYLVLEFDKFNAFFNGEIEGFSDKEFLKQVQPIINNHYFSLSEGSIRPFILIKRNLAEVAVAYKEKDSNLHLGTTKKQGDRWEESSVMDNSVKK